MKHLKIKELLCLVLFAAFLVLVFSLKTGSDKSADELAQAALGVIADEQLVKQSNEKIKTNFGINANDYESVAYYACDEVMNVDEVLVVKLNDDSQANSVILAAEARASSQKNIFDGYAKEQTELLENYVLEHTGNCVFYIVSENANDAGDAVLAFR